MLTTAEKTSAKELLDYLTETELLSLAKTITKGEIAVRDHNDALTSILEYSESPRELLSRKKVRREILVQYLADRGRSFSLGLDKAGICDVVLAHWGSRSTNRLTFQESPASSKDIASNSKPSKSDPPPTACSPIDHTELARQFALWFYPMLNSCSESQTAFGPQHFYERCSLIIKCVSPNLSVETHEGAEDVAGRMLQFVQQERLRFCPNTQDEGLQGCSDDFGIAVISVCGTVHKSAQCIGIFKQQFNMAKDALNGSWKVKHSRLMLAAETVSCQMSMAAVDERLALDAS